MSEHAVHVDRLLYLAEVVCDDIASEEELVELNSILLTDEAYRRDYLDYYRMRVMLRLELRAHRAVQNVRQRINSKSVVPPPDESGIVADETPSTMPMSLPGAAFHGTVGYLSSGWPVAYLVATAILGIGLSVGSLIHVSTPVQIVRPSVPSLSPLAPSPSSGIAFVGRITGMFDCQWADPQTEAFNGAHVPLGRKYALSAGLMEITYATGAKVILQGPVRYEVESKDGGYLSVGKLTARVESQESRAGSNQNTAKSQAADHSSLSTLHSPLFAVRTPTATVTDLGTEFGVDVDKQGNTMSHVFRGVVELRIPSPNGGDQQPIRLAENESVRITSDRNHVPRVSRDTSSHKAFVRVMPAPPRRVPINLVNTGRGVKEGSPDPHWQIVAVSNDPNFKPRPAVVTKACDDIWMPNEPTSSQWISMVSDLSPLPDNVAYTFHAMFELVDVRPETARLDGLFVVDNHVRAIRINGQSVRVYDHGPGQYSFFHPFHITSGFVQGANVIEIEVENGGPGTSNEGSPMGLRLELKGTVQQK